MKKEWQDYSVSQKQKNEFYQSLIHILNISNKQLKIDSMIHFIHSGGGDIINNIDSIKSKDYCKSIETIYEKTHISNITSLFNKCSFESLAYKIYYNIFHESKEYLQNKHNIYCDILNDVHDAKSLDNFLDYLQRNIHTEYITKQFLLLLNDKCNNKKELKEELSYLYKRTKLPVIKEYI